MKNKKILLPIISIVVIGLAAFFVFKYTNNPDQQTIKDFGLKHDQAMKEYYAILVDEVIGGDLRSLNKSTCSQYAEYTSYFDKDTRQMSIADLKNAISLSDSCALDVTSTRYQLVNNFSSEVSELTGISSKFKDAKLIALTGKIVGDLRNAESLSSEKTDISANVVDILKEYWDAELGYKLGNDSFSQREATFEKLNGESDKDGARSTAIDSERKQIITDEGDLWDIYKANTGYIEAATSTPSNTVSSQ